MNCKYGQLEGGLRILLFIFLSISPLSAEPNEPNNGGFELFDYNDVLDFNMPTGWNHDANYAAVVDYLTPREDIWKITTNLLPFEGYHFILLSTGKENVLDIEPNGVKIWQTITVEAEDKLTGVYFFGTCDWSSFDDFADITLIPEPNSGLSELPLVQIAVPDVGNYGSMSGWKRFEHTFEPNEAGIYNLTIRIRDYKDAIEPSYLAVDSLVLCENPAQASDLSCDCTVNFDDFTYIAADWLFNCKDPNVLNDPRSDPNYYNDPNCNCLLGTDLNNDGPVDAKDLAILSENWLKGTKE